MSTYNEDEDMEEAEASEVAEVVRPKRKKVAPKAKLKQKAKANGKAKVVAKKQAKPAKKRAARNVDQSKLDQFGFRLNSKKHKAAVMYASKKGATLNEVKKVLKSTQFNLLTELKEKGFKIKRAVVAGANGRTVTRFHIL
jgi:hypothetical protein